MANALVRDVHGLCALGNEIHGNVNDNVLSGEGGDDLLSGESGNDTAVYAGNRSNYQVSR